jgi:hypothetical protein
MSNQIFFNGQTYASLEDMPPEAREAYQKLMGLLADQDGNGVPDLVDGLRQGQPPDALLKPLASAMSSFTQIVYNGQAFSSVEAMPPEARRAYEQALGALDRHRNGVPEALEHGVFGGAAPFASAPRPAVPAAQPMPMPYTPAGVEPDGPEARARRLRTAALAALGLALVVLIAALALVAVVVLPNLGPR